MTKREAKRVALRPAFEAIQKAVDCGGDEYGEDIDTQKKVDAALDEVCEAMFERWQRAATRDNVR